MVLLRPGLWSKQVESNPLPVIRNEVSRGEGSSQVVAGPAALGLPKREAYLGTLCSEVPCRKAILMHMTQALLAPACRDPGTKV